MANRTLYMDLNGKLKEGLRMGKNGNSNLQTRKWDTL